MNRGKPSLTEPEADRVRAVMRRLLAERFEGNRTKLGEALGIAQSAVTQLVGTPEKDIAPKNRPSERTARIVAKMAGLPDQFWLAEADPEEIARRAVTTTPVPPSHVLETDDQLPYGPERERAAAKLLLEHDWTGPDARACVRALLVFAREGELVTEANFIQGALKARAAMRGRPARKHELGVVEAGREAAGFARVVARGKEVLAKKKGRHGR